MIRSLIPKRKVVILKEDATVFEAARAMCTNEVGCVVVINQKGALSGMVTDRDLTCSAISRNLSLVTPLQKVMSESVWSVDEEATVQEVVQTMKEHGVRRVPVVNTDEAGMLKCIGVIGLDDLIASKSIRLEDAADIIRAQLLHKQHFMQPLRESDIEADAELREFIERIEDRSGISRSATLSLLTIVMSSLVRSVHYGSADKFLAPLPERLRSRLEDLPAGPDANITSDFIIGEVVARFNLDPEQSTEVIRQFWDGMLTCCGQAEMERFTEEIPGDLRDLIIPPVIETKPDVNRQQNPLHMH